MTIDEAIMQCEEAAEDRAKLSKRYDDASGYSRSHNEAIRTNDAKEREKCSQDFRQLAAWLRELKAYKEQEPCEDAISRKFEEIVAEYPPAELCAYPEYRGKPYYSIKYEENGERFVGFGTYSLEVLSRYLREYFMAGAQEPRKAGRKE